MNYYAIIVAGGKGKRMQSAIAKQFLILNKKPVLMHTLQAFFNIELKPKIILVLADADQKIWKKLCVEYNFKIPHQIVAGGSERFHSVRNALLCIKEKSIIAVHDAVRPLVSSKLILSAYQKAHENGNAVPYVKPSDSVRIVENNKSTIFNRENLALIQTPQVFKSQQLLDAYQQTYSDKFTDDASVVETAGYPIHLIEGERNNIKITFTEDLKLATFLLSC